MPITDYVIFFAEPSSLAFEKQIESQTCHIDVRLTAGQSLRD